MHIENRTLHLSHQGAEHAIALPTLAVASTVCVWAVPADYRADGLFISARIPGVAQDIPACDLAACTLLGELDLEPDATAVEAAAAAERLAEVNRLAAAAIQARYPIHRQLNLLRDGPAAERKAMATYINAVRDWANSSAPDAADLRAIEQAA
jgi:hypothetical protein